MPSCPAHATHGGVATSTRAAPPEEPETCSVCACDVDGRDVHRLDCGHAFHTQCIVTWFRYHHDTCPNCRSQFSAHVPARMSDRKRVAAMHRRRACLPRDVQVQLDRHRRAKDMASKRRNESREQRRMHRDVIAKFLRTRRSEAYWAHREHEMRRVLARHVCDGIPLFDQRRQEASGWDSEDVSSEPAPSEPDEGGGEEEVEVASSEDSDSDDEEA